MPETITGVGTTYDNTASVPTAADLASAAGVKAVFQRLLNNAKWLYDRVTSTGVLAVRRVTDLTALAALTGMTDGQVALVDKIGLYQYLAAATDGAAANFIVVPGSGGGRWFNTTYLLRNAANGVPGLGASAKLAVAQVPYGVVAVTHTEPPQTPVALPSEAALDPWADLHSAIVVSNVKQGDIIRVVSVATIIVTTNASGWAMAGRLSIGATTTPGVALKHGTTAYQAPVTIVGSHTCSAGDEVAGTVSVKTQGICQGAATATGIPLAVSILHMRP